MMTAQNRILIVEDDASTRSLMARHFRRKGFEVEQAGDAEEVMAQFPRNRKRFDVVVTDVHLPGASGVDLARRFHELEPEQAIVLMTGDSDASIARRALEDGAAGYLLKPFELFELDAIINSALHNRLSLRFSEPWQRSVVNRVGAGAHITLPARVILSPRECHHSKFESNARVAMATVAFIGLAWLAGWGITS